MRISVDELLQKVGITISDDTAKRLIWKRFRRELYISTGYEIDEAEFISKINSNPKLLLYITMLFEEAD